MSPSFYLTYVLAVVERGWVVTSALDVGYYQQAQGILAPIKMDASSRAF